MKITESVYMLKSSKGSHIYIIKGEESFLIDTGMPGNIDKILDEIKSLDVEPKSIKNILLTHSDIDHIGNAKKLQEITGASLWCSKEEYPYIEKIKKRQGLKVIINQIIKAEKPTNFKFYKSSECINEIKPILTPGHTEGHTIFQYKDVLFVGDLLKVKDGDIRLMPKIMNWNENEAKRSISILKDLNFKWLCPAHGNPVENSEDVKKFLSKY
ncbi:MAG: MBL fold metallo-hydrolase [Clostridium perfringens]|nr:MBL fold metallo-hydrolase [Clostridium perfringens]